MEMPECFGGACACTVVCMRGRGWRAHLSPRSCPQPMNRRGGIAREVLGVRVLVLLCVFEVGYGGLTCLQVAVRSPLVAIKCLCCCVCGIGDGRLTCLLVAVRIP